MIKGVTHAHLWPIWYHSEPSCISYSPNQFLGWDFFWRFLKRGSSGVIKTKYKNTVHLGAHRRTIFLKNFDFRRKKRRHFVRFVAKIVCGSSGALASVWLWNRFWWVKTSLIFCQNWTYSKEIIVFWE